MNSHIISHFVFFCDYLRFVSVQLWRDVLQQSDFEIYVNILLECSSSDALSQTLVALQSLLSETPLLRTFENRMVLVEAMNTRLSDLRASGLWTKEVGLEYAGVLREFTKLKNILRSMQSGILLGERTWPDQQLVASFGVSLVVIVLGSLYNILYSLSRVEMDTHKTAQARIWCPMFFTSGINCWKSNKCTIHSGCAVSIQISRWRCCFWFHPNHGKGDSFTSLFY